MSEVLRIDHSDAPLRRRLAAIAFLDVVGYSRLMSSDDETTVRDWSSLRRQVIEPRVQARGGRVVDRAGDGLFVEFCSALDGFRWAVEVQDAMALRVQAGLPMQVRIALHLGDVIDGPDGEVQGNGVNTAARLQVYAEPGGVVVSQAVADQVRGKTEAAFSDLGPLHLRNIVRPVRAYQLRGSGVRQARTLRQMPRSKLLLAGAVALGMVLVALRPFSVPGQALQSNLSQATPSVTPRAEATRLWREGRAIGCPAHPCPREWLAQRALYEQANVVDPTFAPAHADAAFTYTNFVTTNLSLNKQEDLRAAEKLATRAAALAPQQALSHEARAAVLRHNPDRLEEALTAYLRVAALEPKWASPRANAGWMLISMGRPAEAEPYIHAALSIAPDHRSAPAWLNYLGLAELFQKREGHGAAWFRLALAKQPPAAAAADAGLQRALNLSSALALNGQLEEARALVSTLRLQHPALSTRSVWDCACPRQAATQAAYATLESGLILAGVPDVR